MANANPNEPTGGPTGVDRIMIDPTIPDDDAKFNKALEDAFGPDALGRNNNAVTTDTGTEDEDEDNEGTPGAETDPNAGASAEGEDEGGEGTEQTSGAIGGDATDFASLFRSRYNRDPEPGELEGYIQLAEWAAQLTPEQQLAINNALTNPSMYIAPQQQQTQTPVPDPTPDPLVEEFGEDHPLIQRIKQLEANQQQVSQLSVEQQQRQMLENIAVGAQSFRTRYEDLSDIELEQLQGAVAQSRIFPGFVQANNGDIAKGMEAALDYAYWQNPAYREREIQKQYAKVEEQKKEEAARKRKASSVTSTGGNGASRTAPPPKTNDDRWAAVAAGLGEAMNNGQQN